MTDANARRNHAESIERLHAPLQELITRVVALELHLHVLAKRVAGGREINLHRVIDDEIDRHQRLNHARIFVQSHDRRSHGREIDKQGHSGKILQQDARNDKRHLFGPLGVGFPVGNRADVVFRDLGAVEISQH